MAVSRGRRRPKQAQNASNIPRSAPGTTYVHCYQSHVASIRPRNRLKMLIPSSILRLSRNTAPIGVSAGTTEKKKKKSYYHFSMFQSTEIILSQFCFFFFLSVTVSYCCPLLSVNRTKTPPACLKHTQICSRYHLRALLPVTCVTHTASKSLKIAQNGHIGHNGHTGPTGPTPLYF